MSNYSEKIDKIVFDDLKLLGWEVKNFAMIVIFCPLHMLWLCFRIMFPWLIPFINKEGT